MERKIGEIFNIDNEWYQVVKSNGECCKGCAFYEKGCKAKYADVGGCGTSREDWTQVIFKKLEKVGEPYSCNYYGDNRLIMMQEYNLFNLDDVTNEDKIPMYITDYKHKRIAIEIKETKEDMEQNKLNLKPFDIQKAKEGKPVCTRDGRKARIISCSLRNKNFPIAAIVEDEDEEENVYQFEANGVCDEHDENLDLMMLPEKRSGWVNVYTDSIYDTKEEALAGKSEIRGYIDTIKVTWEE